MLGSGAMQGFLYIPWFQAHAWDIPLPFSVPVLGNELSIQPFGVLVATGVLFGAWVAGKFAERNGLDRNNTADLMEELGEMVNARCVHAGAGWCECLGLGFRLVGMFGFRV